jgi:hypothetical protein
MPSSGEVPELERRRRHHARQQKTAARSPPTPKAEYKNRSSPNRRPDPATLPSHYSSLPRPTRLLRVASTVHPPPVTHLIPCPPDLPAPIPAAAPPEAAPAPRLARPGFTWTVEGVRREAADAPSSKSPGGKPRKHPMAGRRPVALIEETHRAKQMEGNTRRETSVPSASASLFPAPASRCSTIPPAMGPSIAFTTTRNVSACGASPATRYHDTDSHISSR